MLAWMGYATLVGALLVIAGALLERVVDRRRIVWLAVIAGSLAFATVATTAPDPSRAPLPAIGQSPVAAPASRAPVSRVDVPSATTTTALPSLDVILLVAWLAGSTLCIAVLVVSAWRVSRMRRNWRESMIAGVPVLVSHDVGPAVIGLVHHGIVVPSWVETLGEDDQRTVMTHEREHVRAGDPLMLWGATLLVVLAPWNAALWYALRSLRHAIEIDCDARVLRTRPDTHAYCSLLLDVGERTLAGVAPVAALAEPATLLERRIDAMMSPVRVRTKRATFSAAAALLLVAVACWTPHPKVAPQARVAALVKELNTLLASDSVRRTLSDTEQASVRKALASALASEKPPARQFGMRVDSIAHADFPEAFEKRDDAIVVAVLFDANANVVRKVARRFPVDEAFDVVPGTPARITGSRNVDYLLSRIFPSPFPQSISAGTQTMYDAAHAILLYAELAPGKAVPVPLPVEKRRQN